MSVCCKLQACNCGRRVRAGATREFSRAKFLRCSRKEIARNKRGKREVGLPENECHEIGLEKKNLVRFC